MVTIIGAGIILFMLAVLFMVIVHIFGDKGY